MKRYFAIAMIALSTTICTAADLPRSTPEEQGVSSSGILEFINAVDKEIDSLNSFMLLRHGHVVAEGWWSPYDPQAPHSLYSLSKSFTSTAVGLAISEGKLRVDDPVIKFFPDELPSEPSNNLKAMRVSDLLRMATGQQTEPPRTPEANWVKTFLAHPVPFKPGTHFLYNTSATYMQSAIVQKVTGATVLDYLRPRLFEPLGIENPTWELSPQGISTGGYGLSVRTEDIAKFGQLYLQKGVWQGKQLVPKEWIDEATARQVSNGSNPSSDWDQGYGYQFWRCRHGAYRGDGAFGQYCIVLPQQDAVIAITSGLKEMQSVMNLIWEKLLPAMKSSPLAADLETQTKLSQTLKGLTIRPQTGSGNPQTEILGKKFVFPPNDHKLESLILEQADKEKRVTVVTRFDGTEHRTVCGNSQWTKGKAGWSSLREQPIAASGSWTSDDTYTAKTCFYETPFTVTASFKFVGNEVHYFAKTNVGFGPKNEFQLVGTPAVTSQK
jgi:Beta-lactamase